MSDDQVLPMYQKIKEHILEHIANGDWQPNQKLPSENEISAILNISRMTVNRAFKELTEEGYLFREKGAGTFVATPFQLNPFFELIPIAQEIAIEGRKFSTEIIKMNVVENLERHELHFYDVDQEKVFYSEIIYLSEGIPIQFEKRYVLASFAPNYLKEQFKRDCSTTYLQKLSTVLSQKHTLEAVIPDEKLRTILKVDDHVACFKICEKLQYKNKLISYAEQYYPASRYKFHSKI
ncbi:GntR family transcriptional regulator [Wohlfahrtiimonas larvae]|nr:GntR family transcriptional regulator [Wohlfahrtiimonas larvae]